MTALYIIVLLANVLSLFSKKGRRAVGVLSLIVLGAVILTMQNDGLDLYNYKRRYENIYASDIGVQPLYHWIQVFFRNLNIDFDGFRIICFVLCLGGVYCILNKITDSFNTFTIVYMMYFFFLDGEQIRNFMACCIFGVALYYLFSDEKHSIRNYVICIICATLIHTVFIVYLSFIIIKFKFDLNKMILRITPVIAVLTWIIFRYFNALEQILMFIDDSRASSYAGARTNLGWVVPTFIYLMSYLLVRKLNKEYGRGHNTMNRIERFKFVSPTKIKRIPRYVNASQTLARLLDVNTIGLMFLPLMLGSLTFYRISKNIVFGNCVFLAVIWDHLFKNEGKLKYMGYFLWLVFVIAGYCIFDFYLYNEWENFYEIYFAANR